MNARSNFATVTQLIRDTFRQAVRLRDLLDDAGGHGDLRGALPERERVGRRVAP